MSNNLKLAELEQAAQLVLDKAKSFGATAAEVGATHSKGLSISVRQGETETIEHNNDTGLGVTVYFDKSKASASTTDLRETSITDTVKSACDIAKHTQADEYAGLADKSLMASKFDDLSLYHPWDIEVEQAIELARECEHAGLAVSEKLTNTEGGSLSTHEGARVYANSHGFLGSNVSSRHSLSCTLIAEDAKGMQRDYWYDVKRDAADMLSAVEIGEKAAESTINRLDARSVETGAYPVIFNAQIAPSLFGKFISAIRGSAQYRKSSFLLDSLDKQVFPDFVHIHEQPHILKGLGSTMFDGEGVATQARDIVTQGVLNGYVLDSYSARKLGMQTTANAGGVHNLVIDTSDSDFASLVKQMHKGVIVTETMGMGVNIVTGDYSQGAAGFWVDNGEIQYPIDEFTIAGNLKEMLMGIQTIANDVETRGNIRTGSVLIDSMMIAS
jgi:PmbA protein